MSYTPPCRTEEKLVAIGKIAPDALQRPHEADFVATAKYNMSKMMFYLRDSLASRPGNEDRKISRSELATFASAEAAMQGLPTDAIATPVEIIEIGAFSV